MAAKSIGSLETWEPEDKSFSKHVLKDGTGESKPNDGSVCVIYINPVSEIAVEEDDLGGYKLNEDCEVTIGEGDTRISAFLDQILMSMKEGEMAYIKGKVNSEGKKLTEFEFKEKGIKFNVTMKSFDRASDMNELEQDEKLDRAQHHKEKGTDLYQRDHLEFSLKRYQKALNYLKDMEPADNLPEGLAQRYKKLKCQCFLNLGACYLKTEEFDKVVEHCSAALELEPENVKALFRRAQANTKLHEYSGAKEDLVSAQKLDKSNKAVFSQLQLVESLSKKEKQMYQKMFAS